MIRPRIIPIVLILDNYAVKTIKFQKPKYIGDPINIVRIFNEYEADELVIYDINKNKEKEINFELIKNIGFNARMPLCYGGRIKNLQHIGKLFSLGVEKVSISSMVLNNFNFIKSAVSEFGSQSITLTLDIDINDSKIHVNGQEFPNINAIKELIKHINEINVGEIIIQSVQRDGTEVGLDEYFIDQLYYVSNSPITFVGGASSYENITNIAKKYSVIGIGAGSVFTYKGSQRAVMINYLDKEERNRLT